MPGRQFRVAEILKAIPATGGIPSLIAAKVGCDRSTIYRMKKRSRKVADAMRAEEQKQTEVIEGKLLAAALKSEPWAVKMWLSCRHKDRWSQRTELAGTVETKSQITVLEIPDNKRGVKMRETANAGNRNGRD